MTQITHKSHRPLLSLTSRFILVMLIAAPALVANIPACAVEPTQQTPVTDQGTKATVPMKDLLASVTPATTLLEALHNIKFIVDHELLYRQEDFYTEANLQRFFGKHEVYIRGRGVLGGMKIPYGGITFDPGRLTLDARYVNEITVADVEAIFGRGWKAVKPRPFSSHQSEWPPPTRPGGNLRMWYLIAEENPARVVPRATLIDVQFGRDATLLYVEISAHVAPQKGD